MQSPETIPGKKDMQEKGRENAANNRPEYAGKVARQVRYVAGNIHHQPLGAQQQFVP